MNQSLKAALLGCLEIPLFMRQARDRFVNSPEAARWSFLVPLFLLPLAILIAPINPDFKDMPTSRLAFLFSLDCGVTLLLYLLFIYQVSKTLDRSQYFYQFVNTYNWLNLTSFMISLPFFILVMKGIYKWEEVENILLCLILYGYAYIAYAIAITLKINWQLAAGLSIVGMAIGQAASAMIY